MKIVRSDEISNEFSNSLKKVMSVFLSKKAQLIQGPQEVISKEAMAILKQVAVILHAADQTLPPEAEEAIKSFVGTPRGGVSEDMFPGGIMNQGQLEDVFSPSPSKEGSIIAQQLEQAMIPVRNELQKIFGPTIPLYRGQREVPVGSKTRNVLSWTLWREVAEEFVSMNNVRRKRITDAEIEKSVQEFKQKRQVVFRGQLYRSDPEFPDQSILSRYVGKADTDDVNTSEDEAGFALKGEPIEEVLRAILKDKQTYYESVYQENLKKAHQVQFQNVPLDRIAWATDRAGQLEFILKTR